MLDDKDIVASVASLRTLVDDWYLASLDVPRGVTAARLREALGGEGQCFDSVHAARTAALSVMSEDDRLVIFGSFYTVAAALG